VPRVQGSLGLTAALPSWTGALDWRYVGAQFDDDLNLFVLKRAGVLNVRGGWRATSRVELFVASENLLDEVVEAGRTPLLTLGASRVWRAGINARW
jgi:outer membrane receptor protein involved in Fe transport